MFTDGNRSFSFQTPLQMQRFLGAALAFCKLYPNNVAYVLRCLGSQDTAGLQRLREISSFPHTVTVSCCYICQEPEIYNTLQQPVMITSICLPGMQAGTSRTLCSFQRVTCAMLHLITLPLLANSLLTQCYNPMLAIVADNLDLTAVCNSAEALSVRGSIADPNFRPIDQVCST